MNTVQRVTHASPDWQAFTVEDMARGVDLDREGVLPRVIVLLEPGALLVTNAAGDARPIPYAPAGYAHPGACRAILPGQPVPVVVYW